jgi:hypothetical protein
MPLKKVAEFYPDSRLATHNHKSQEIETNSKLKANPQLRFKVVHGIILDDRYTQLERCGDAISDFATDCGIKRQEQAPCLAGDRISKIEYHCLDIR